MKSKLLKKIRERFKISDINHDVVMLDRKKQLIYDTKEFGTGFTKVQKNELLTYKAIEIMLGFWTFLGMYQDKKKRYNKRIAKRISQN